jgi:natural resistance-associated macrophage protein 2
MERPAVDPRRLLPADDGDASASARPPRPPQPSGFSWRKFWAYTGPGWLMSMAYLDPGNLEADLQSGAYARYELLYVVLLSTAAGGVYQILAARLGAVTGRHLAQLCRAEYPRVVSLALWLMTEIAIIGSDVQEVLGSAIAFQILFRLPLWAGCLLTGVDTLTFLLLHRSGSANRGRYLELFFLLLITTMCVCFFADFTVSDPNVREIARGIVWPRLKDQNAMQAVASLGALIMPHNLFLHSALVQQRGLDRTNARRVRDANFYFALESSLALFVSFLINAAVVCVFASSFYSAQCASLSAPDSISSLANTGIQTACIPLTAARASGKTIYDAVTGNKCRFGETAVAACAPCFVDRARDRLVGFFGTKRTAPTAGYCQEIGLAEAGNAVKEALGGYARTVWAVGLLASGQASTMTGTYAGQFVMEGFLDLKLAAWKRVALTRSVALVPAVAVAFISQHHQFQSDRFNELLNVLQSVQLPFALLPLLTFTGAKTLMGDTFVTSRAVAFVLLVATGLLCSVNYALVYRVFTKTVHLDALPLLGRMLLALAIVLYAALLLYLVLGYPSSRGGSIQGYDNEKQRRQRQRKRETEKRKQEQRRKLRKEQQALLADDEVQV